MATLGPCFPAQQQQAAVAAPVEAPVTVTVAAAELAALVQSLWEAAL
jgi:hypothetical protein